jgi:hypothetical protein
MITALIILYFAYQILIRGKYCGSGKCPWG